MPLSIRRTLLHLCLTLTCFLVVPTPPTTFADDGPTKSPLSLATFDIDATPPVGDVMAYDPVRGNAELGLRCRGIVLIGAGQPIVLCAVDWIGISNQSHDAFRERIATAAGTIPNRVAVHTLHQHDAPRSDFGAESLLNQIGASDLGAYDGRFARQVIDRLSIAVKESISAAKPITHAGFGVAEVEKVASNRRIQDEQGNVVATRYTTTKDPALRALPDGTIDAELSALSFWNKDKPLAVLTYYACHPQSYYRTGIPSPDFPGIARFIRGQDLPAAMHVHFNGAGGDIGAGKYNDGSHSNRMVLAGRVADGMRRAFENTQKRPITSDEIRWATQPVQLPLAKHLDRDALVKKLQQWDGVQYWGTPDKLAWMLRCESGHAIDIACLSVGDVRVLHMPGELFVEYQLAAKAMRPSGHVAMAAYGDYGPGYIGTQAAYGQGGYETSEPASNVAPEVEKVLMDAMRVLLKDDSEPTASYQSELPRIAPTSPQDAVATMDVADGFTMQLIAAEPLIASPVAMQWDASGALYVCEMRGYSEDRDEGLSRIARLRDLDGDGIYDERTTFAEGLLWPTGLFPYDGGLFVGDAPDLLYFKDTDDDGVADVRQRVLTGFGTSNVQGLMNSFRWGLDNRIHIACSSTGGEIRDPHAPADQPGLNIRGRDLALDPKTYRFEPTSGAAQHGMAFDDWGNKFASSNSDHIQQVMFRDRDVAGNPFHSPPPSRISIAADGPQAEVFRTSPVEPWRLVRTRLRVAGLAKGPIEGGGRAAGYFTGATGVTIYRGDTWPQQWKGTAIVGDVGGNLIHRKRLDRSDSEGSDSEGSSSEGSSLEFIARRIDERDEFVTSTDIWFRPVQFANAPDGSLHVIDMYREVIEHPASLPPEIKQHLDLTSGRDKGRLYRIVPKGFQPRKVDDLSQMTPDQLCTLLAHPNAWHRETASRLLYERQDASAVLRLRGMVENDSSMLARMHAMYVLDGMNQLDEATLLVGLGTRNAQVRRHAVGLSVGKQDTPAIRNRLFELTHDESIDVRYELAFALANASADERVSGLVALLRHDPTDRWITAAVQTAIGDQAKTLATILDADASLRNRVGEAFVSKLADQIAARERHPNPSAASTNAHASTRAGERSPEDTAAREAVIDRYRDALKWDGDGERGRTLFQKHCSSCHRVDGVGHELGPSLAAIATRGAETLLASVMDPNREVNPQYLNYVVLTSDAEIVAGMIVDEGATSVTIRRADNTVETVLRIDIEEIRNTGQSFMPEGFEDTLDKQSITDLTAYLVPTALVPTK